MYSDARIKGSLVDKSHQELVYQVCVSSFRNQLVLQFHQSDHDDSDFIVRYRFQYEAC